VVDYEDGREWKGKDWAKGEELWNFRNLALTSSETVGILRALWVDMVSVCMGMDSAEDFGLETLDALDVG
jgi:hypothetical protein